MNTPDGREEFIRIVGWQARIGQSYLLEKMVPIQGVVVEAMVEFGVCCSFKEASYQHGLCLEFHMVETQTTEGYWPVEDYQLRFLQLVSIQPGFDLAVDGVDVHGSQVQTVALVPALGQCIAIDGPWALI